MHACSGSGVGTHDDVQGKGGCLGTTTDLLALGTTHKVKIILSLPLIWELVQLSARLDCGRNEYTITHIHA